MNSVELNGSFYSLQRPTSYASWYESTPPDFLFSVKGPRFVTHMLRLKEPRQAIANFFASGVLALGSKLGPVLWQLPADLAFDAGLLERFCNSLPRTTGEAARLAEEHDARLDGRSSTVTDADRPLRHALEARSADYATRASTDILRRHEVSLIISDGADRWPMLGELTADFVYVRLHGHPELYTSRYSPQSIGRWSSAVTGWLTGSSTADGLCRDVFVYFDNDAAGHAPHDALRLARSVARRNGRL
jgi:uncharacterized protein YecE (DUF72 family)